MFTSQHITLNVYNESSTVASASRAEYQRIAAEMEKLSKRQIWPGVEKQFLPVS